MHLSTTLSLLPSYSITLKDILLFNYISLGLILFMGPLIERSFYSLLLLN